MQVASRPVHLATPRSQREFLDVLEREGELVRVSAEVDRDLEIGAITRRLCESRPDADGVGGDTRADLLARLAHIKGPLAREWDRPGPSGKGSDPNSRTGAPSPLTELALTHELVDLVPIAALLAEQVIPLRQRRVRAVLHAGLRHDVRGRNVGRDVLPGAQDLEGP